MSTHLRFWLFKSCSKLYDRYKEGLFTLEDAEKTLEMKTLKLPVTISGLRRRGYLTLSGRRGRARIYRLINPMDALFSFVNMKNLEKLKSDTFKPLIIKAIRSLHEAYGDKLISACLFGSVARGTARLNSDVGLLIVTDSIGGSLGKRLENIYSRIIGLKGGREFLYRNGVATGVSLYPLSKKEAQRLLPIYFDVIEEESYSMTLSDFSKRYSLNIKPLS
jgi:predicted nucleotidyltransferase